MIIVNAHRLCKTNFSKAIGLMFSKKKDDFGIVMSFKKPTKTTLHMFFVFHSIDVLFLNKKMKVIEIKENFKPFSVYYPTNEANYIVEIPAGKVKSSKIGLLDKIIVKS